MRKTRYYLLGSLVLIVLLLAYHFYAAHQAEQQISEALKEQAQQSNGAYSISYEDIEVSAFSGDIEFRELNLTHGNYIHRASLLNFDLSYFDFLRIYIGGTEFGLRRINDVHSILEDLSILYRPEVREIKLDTVHLNYEGNLYDLLRHSVTANPLEGEHLMEGSGTRFRLNQPQAPWGQVQSDSLSFSSIISSKARSFWDTNQLTLQNSSIRWNPPREFQEKYGFFLRGFGYQADDIPIDSTQLILSRDDTLSAITMEIDLYTELFHTHAESLLQLNRDNLRRSILRDGILRLRGTSEEFKDFLSSAEQLFGVSLSEENREIARFSGPIINPKFTAAPRQ